MGNAEYMGIHNSSGPPIEQRVGSPITEKNTKKISMKAFTTACALIAGISAESHIGLPLAGSFSPVYGHGVAHHPLTYSHMNQINNHRMQSNMDNRMDGRMNQKERMMQQRNQHMNQFNNQRINQHSNQMDQYNRHNMENQMDSRMNPMDTRRNHMDTHMNRMDTHMNRM